MKNILFIIRIGGLLSIVGTALLVIFAYVLLVYPVEKICPTDSTECEYISRAPASLSILINPFMLAISLLVIACGVCFFRFGFWHLNKKTRKEQDANPR
jgi:predicted membrane protein